MKFNKVKISELNEGCYSNSEARSEATPYYLFAPSVQIPFLNELYGSIFGYRNYGTVLEVGAYDGITCSNSLGLADKGWDVFLIEPVPEFAFLATKLHKDRSNVKVFQTAISNQNSILTLNVAGALTTSKVKIYEEYKKLTWAKGSIPKRSKQIKVECMTLNSFIETQLPTLEIDVLIIDVEGSEIDVMQGFDLEKHMPRMIIIELPDFHPDLKHGRRQAREIYEGILHAGYKVIYKDAINTCFLRKDVWQNLE